MSSVPEAPPRGLLTALRIYKRFLSPVLHALTPGGCRYLPTCSEYACVACARFGAARGAWLSLRRLLRCNPWSRGGLDPVPDPHPRDTRRPTLAA